MQSSVFCVFINFFISVGALRMIPEYNSVQDYDWTSLAEPGETHNH